MRQQEERGFTYVVRCTYQADTVLVHLDTPDKHASREPSARTVGGIGIVPEPDHGLGTG